MATPAAIIASDTKSELDAFSLPGSLPESSEMIKLLQKIHKLKLKQLQLHKKSDGTYSLRSFEGYPTTELDIPNTDEAIVFDFIIQTDPMNKKSLQILGQKHHATAYKSHLDTNTIVNRGQIHFKHARIDFFTSPPNGLRVENASAIEARITELSDFIDVQLPLDKFRFSNASLDERRAFFAALRRSNRPIPDALSTVLVAGGIDQKEAANVVASGAVTEDTFAIKIVSPIITPGLSSAATPAAAGAASLSPPGFFGGDTTGGDMKQKSENFVLDTGTSITHDATGSALGLPPTATAAFTQTVITASAPAVQQQPTTHSGAAVQPLIFTPPQQRTPDQLTTVEIIDHLTNGGFVSPPSPLTTTIPTATTDQAPPPTGRCECTIL